MPFANVRFVVALAAAVIVGVALSASPNFGKRSDDSTSPFHFTEALYQLGKYPQNHQLESEVVLRNDSQKTLTIRKYLASCRCTVVGKSIEGLELAPGSELAIPISIETGVNSLLSSSIVVAAEDKSGLEHLASCAVSADILPDYLVFQQILDFGVTNASTKEHPKKRLTVYPKEKVDLEIVSCHSSQTAFSATAEPGQEGIDIIVEFDPAKASQTQRIYSSVITVTTNSTRVPTFEFYARAAASDMWACCPTEAIFVGGSHPEPIICNLKRRDGVKFQIEAVVISDKAFQCDFDPSKWDDQHPVTFSATQAVGEKPQAGEKPQVGEAIVRVRLAGADQTEETRIPLVLLENPKRN